MNQSHEQTSPSKNQKLDIAINIVDQLIALRTTVTELSGSGSLINKKSLLSWTAQEWSSFFFESIDIQQAAAQICDATIPVVGQHNTQLVLAGNAIAKAYRHINALPVGESLTRSQLLELATPIAEHITLSIIASTLLLTSTGTRILATNTSATTKNNICNFFMSIPESINTLTHIVKEYFSSFYQNYGMFGATHNNSERVAPKNPSNNDILQQHGI